MKKQYIVYILDMKTYSRDFYFCKTKKEALSFISAMKKRSYNFVKFRLFKSRILLTDYGICEK